MKAEWRGGQPLLSGKALFCGYYLNELLMNLLPREDAHEKLFAAYVDTLRRFAEGVRGLICACSNMRCWRSWAMGSPSRRTAKGTLSIRWHTMPTRSSVAQCASTGQATRPCPYAARLCSTSTAIFPTRARCRSRNS